MQVNFVVVSIGTLYEYFPRKEAIFTEPKREFIDWRFGASSIQRQPSSLHPRYRRSRPFLTKTIVELYPNYLMANHPEAGSSLASRT